MYGLYGRYLRLMKQILGQNGRHGPVATARHDKTHLGVEDGGIGCCLEQIQAMFKN